MITDVFIIIIQENAQLISLEDGCIILNGQRFWEFLVHWSDMRADIDFL